MVTIAAVLATKAGRAGVGVLLGRLADQDRQREGVTARARLGYAAIAGSPMRRAPGTVDIAVQANPAVRVARASGAERQAASLVDHDAVIVSDPSDSSRGTLHSHADKTGASHPLLVSYKDEAQHLVVDRKGPTSVAPSAHDR